MATTVIYNNFRAPKFWRNRFRRSHYQIWDANLHHGDVRPFACPELLCEDVGNLQTLYPLPECKCYGKEQLTDIVRGFCHEQHFHLDDGILRQSTEEELCNDTPPCRAGVPIPSTPNVSAPCNSDGCDAVGVSYVRTWVTEHAGIQVEGAPSPASEVVPTAGHIPNATITWSAAAEGYCVVAMRLYRVEASFKDGTSSIAHEGAEWVLVGQFEGSGSGTFTDTLEPSETGGPLTTHQPMLFAAPNDLVGLARTLDGIAVATKHRLYISAPGQPQFGWDGIVEVEDEILAIRAIQNTIFIFTDNKPVKVSYRHTNDVMTINKDVIERRLPLKSIKSLSVYDNKVFFSSTHSLYSWNTAAYGSDIRSSLTPLVTPEQWKNIDAESVIGVGYEFGYMFTADGIDHSIMVEFGGDGTDTINATSMMPISYINPQAFGLDYDGHIVYQEDGNFYKWDWRQDMCTDYDLHDHVRKPLCEQCDCCPWKVMMYFDNEGKNRFSKMRVEWDERTATHLEVSFYLYAFGKENKIMGPEQIINSRGFSTPKYCSSQTFCVEVQGCGVLHEIRVGTSNQELVSSSNNQIGNAEQELI